MYESYQIIFTFYVEGGHKQHWGLWKERTYQSDPSRYLVGEWKEKGKKKKGKRKMQEG